jgi:hypothetical protein
MKDVAKVAADAAEPKPYVRPELTKHGKIESLTQIVPVKGGCSHPLGGGSAPAL